MGYPMEGADGVTPVIGLEVLLNNFFYDYASFGLGLGQDCWLGVLPRGGKT